MVWRHSSFLIDKIWLDWQDNILLWIILFSVLRRYILIGKIRTFQIIIVRPLGLADRAFTLGCHRGVWVLHWAYHSFGLGKWASGGAHRDSQLVVRQIEDTYEAKSERMVLYLQKVRDLLKKFVLVQIKHVPEQRTPEPTPWLS